MTNPFANGVFGQQAAPVPFAQPVAAPHPVAPPANQWLGQGAPAPQAGGPLSPLAGLGSAPAGGGQGVSTGGLLNYLLLIVPTAVQHNVPKPRGTDTQTKVTADVLVIRAPGGQTGALTITCPGMVGDPPRVLTHHNGADGNPDPAKPFIHNPAQGQFLSFPAMWIYGGPLAEKLLTCLDPNVPTLTMVANYITSKKSKSTGNNYNDYGDPAPGDWAEINAVAGAWLAQRGQSQFG